MSSLVDSLGRRVTTLRISLTDRCNFRCVYCMPPEGLAVMPTSLRTSPTRRPGRDIPTNRDRS